jgi:hypothetical protein
MDWGVKIHKKVFVFTPRTLTCAPLCPSKALLSTLRAGDSNAISLMLRISYKRINRATAIKEKKNKIL